MIARSLTHCTCGEPYGVIQSGKIVIHGTQTVWRRRKCRACNVLKRTVELPEDMAKKVLALMEQIQSKGNQADAREPAPLPFGAQV